VRIRYTAGLASSPVQEADEDIQLPILLLVAHFYENPTAVFAVERGTPGQIVLTYALEHYLQKLQVEYVF
jgi:hypothetical protein